MRTPLLHRTIASIAAFLCMASTAFAGMTVTQIEDQGFDKYDLIWQMRDVTVTEDTQTPLIKSVAGIRVVLPKDLPAVYDRSKNLVNMTGTAVTTGKVQATVTVSFDATAKVALIPVKQDFAAGDSVTISGLTLKGFYTETLIDQKVGIAVTADNAVVASSNKVLYVRNVQGKDDNTPPEAPENLKTVSDGSSATLTWTDSVDMDVNQIEVFRKIAPFDYTRIVTLPKGVGAYKDTSVTSGATYSYALKASDGRNQSPLSTEVSVTISATPAMPDVCTLEYAPVCGKDGKTYGNRCEAEKAGQTDAVAGACVVVAPETPDTPTPTTPASPLPTGVTQADVDALTFTDIEKDSWYAPYLARMVKAGIMKGYGDGTVHPERPINRAEYARMVVASLTLIQVGQTNAFIDIPSGVWYQSDVGKLQAQGALWTTSKRYKPEGYVTRGEAVWVLLTAAGYGTDTPVTQKPFPDISAQHTYASAVTLAKDIGLVVGKTDGNFGIRDTITRAEAAKILTLLLEEKDFNK